MKNGRRSWKNVSNAERLSTLGSASTWPKSGLIVPSTVRFEVTPYLKSAPAVACWSRLNPVAVGTETFFVTEYGVTSSRRGDPRPSSPVRSPSCEESPALDTWNTGQATRSV